MVIAQVERSEGTGGCPLGSLGGQLAESDPQARGQLAVGFARWSTTLRDGLRALHATGHLKPGVEPEDLAETLLCALQGGLLLAQVHRDSHPLKTTLDTIFALTLAP